MDTFMVIPESLNDIENNQNFIKLKLKKQQLEQIMQKRKVVQINANSQAILTQKRYNTFSRSNSVQIHRDRNQFLQQSNSQMSRRSNTPKTRKTKQPLSLNIVQLHHPAFKKYSKSTTSSLKSTARNINKFYSSTNYFDNTLEIFEGNQSNIRSQSYKNQEAENTLTLQDIESDLQKLIKNEKTPNFKQHQKGQKQEPLNNTFNSLEQSQLFSKTFSNISESTPFLHATRSLLKSPNFDKSDHQVSMARYYKDIKQIDSQIWSEINQIDKQNQELQVHLELEDKNSKQSQTNQNAFYKDAIEQIGDIIADIQKMSERDKQIRVLASNFKTRINKLINKSSM